MSGIIPVLYLARHGETAWTLTGQHTGLTDLPLTERSERNARQLGERLIGLIFAKVFTSPPQRAVGTEVERIQRRLEIARQLPALPAARPSLTSEMNFMTTAKTNENKI